MERGTGLRLPVWAQTVPRPGAGVRPNSRQPTWEVAALTIARLWAALEAALCDTDIELANRGMEAALRRWGQQVFDPEVDRWVPL